jgi:hypothetical protein
MYVHVDTKGFETSLEVPLEFCNFMWVVCSVRGRDSSVGIATGYGLEGPGIESRWGPDSSHTSRPALGPT